MSAETFQFQAETKQLLELMIHSLYSSKEIFLRELISNASDALDRLHFQSLTDSSLNKDVPKEIRLEVDKDAKILTISDTGIGMTREELIKNIGTIAQSGTKELLDALKEDSSSETVSSLIGQFGVGFYSAFMGANKISLVTRKAGEESATRWESEGAGEYTLSDATRANHGTTITLFLKDADPENGLDDFTSEYTIENVVKRYSDFVRYPIILKTQREEVEKDEEGKEIEGGKKSIVVEDKTLNSMKPLWVRSKNDVTEEEYTEFYKQISRSWEAPLSTIPLSVEGMLEYKALLFIPKKAPFDLYHHVPNRGLRLYVRSVLIKEHCEELLPSYLRFVQGVVDSSDLPLNVSREMLQQDRHVKQIRKFLTKKVLDDLKYLLKEEYDKYCEFWEELGRPLKEGASSDYDNRDKILPLLLFSSSHEDGKLGTLDGYVERMKEGQKEIFYMTGESKEEIESSPHLEAFKAKGYEVLYLTDPIDELVFQSLFQYKDFKFKSAGKGDVELGSDEEKEENKKKLEEQSKDYADLFEFLKEKLSESVKEVRLSSRLTSSPACLVGSDFDLSPQLERFLKQRKEDMPKQKRILELNPEHSLIKKMLAGFNEDKESTRWQEYGDLLFGYALLAEGSKLPDPARFNRLVVEMMDRELAES